MSYHLHHLTTMLPNNRRPEAMPPNPRKDHLFCRGKHLDIAEQVVGEATMSPRFWGCRDPPPSLPLPGHRVHRQWERVLANISGGVYVLLEEQKRKVQLGSVRLLKSSSRCDGRNGAEASPTFSSLRSATCFPYLLRQSSCLPGPHIFTSLKSCVKPSVTKQSAQSTHRRPLVDTHGDRIFAPSP